jgi:hypothetical protein
MDTSGFYKIDPESGELLYAPNGVYAPTFTLLREDRESHEYPVDGWIWFDGEPTIGPDGEFASQ